MCNVQVLCKKKKSPDYSSYFDEISRRRELNQIGNLDER